MLQSTESYENVRINNFTANRTQELIRSPPQHGNESPQNTRSASVYTNHRITVPSLCTATRRAARHAGEREPRAVGYASGHDVTVTSTLVHARTQTSARTDVSTPSLDIVVVGFQLSSTICPPTQVIHHQLQRSSPAFDHNLSSHSRDQTARAAAAVAEATGFHKHPIALSRPEHALAHMSPLAEADVLPSDARCAISSLAQTNDRSGRGRSRPMEWFVDETFNPTAQTGKL